MMKKEKEGYLFALQGTRSVQKIEQNYDERGGRGDCNKNL